MRLVVMARELLTRARAAGVSIQGHDGALRLTGPPHAAQLMDELLARRGELVHLLRAEESANIPSDMPAGGNPADTTNADDPPAYVARCPTCGGVNWGPVADPVLEVLRTGERVLTERWGCLICATRPEGTP